MQNRACHLAPLCNARVAAKRTRPKVHSVLYIHQGDQDRSPIEKDCFDTFMKRIHQEIAKMVWSNQWDPSKNVLFPWNFWSKGAGIIGCQNQASEDFMLELTKNIKWSDKKFRAWKTGQYGYPTHVTMVLPPGTLDIFKQDDIVPLVLKQNGLEGSHSVPRFKFKDEGVIQVKIGIGKDLENGLRATGGRIGLGAMAIKINIKKLDEENNCNDAPR